MPETNFSPQIFWSGFTFPTTGCISGNCFGSGAPSNADGFDGYTYIDESSDDFYVKVNGAWVMRQAAAGTGAGLTMYQGAALDPNGSISGSVGDMYHSKTTLGGDGSTWVKISGTSSTTVWE